MVSYSSNCPIEPSARLHRQEAAMGACSQQTEQATLCSDRTLHVDGWYQKQDPKPAAALSNTLSASALPHLYQHRDLSEKRPTHHTSMTTTTTTTTTTTNHTYTSPVQNTAQQRASMKRARGQCSSSTEDDAVQLQQQRGEELVDFAADEDARRCSKRARDDRAASGLSLSHGGVRINDLLNPAAAAIAAAASAAAPSLAGAHRMSVPSAISRSRSADTKYYYQQLLHLQLQLQRQQQAPHQQQTASSALSVDPRSRFVRTSTAPAEPAASAGSEGGAQGLVREALELDKLYDIACVIIESIWPNHSISQRTQLCSLRCFVAETHRQSRLSVDVLELCMFYLLRAKSIIQARQRAQRQKEEEEEQQKKELEAQARRIQQGQEMRDAMESANNTPPLSPSSPLNANSSRRASADASSSQRAVVGAPAVVTTAAAAAATNGGSIMSPPNSSPITPASAQQMGQITYITMDKDLLGNGMITPLTPEKNRSERRVLAGSANSLPNSYRQFVATKAANAPAVAPETRSVSVQQLASPEADKPLDGEATQAAKPKPKKPDVTKCGRRMFVAALISASKFMFDRTYSNRAWNKITKLPLAQISDMERAFLDMIDYRLYVDRSTYEKFHRLLARSGMRNGRLMVCEPAASVDATGPTAPSPALSAASSSSWTAASSSAASPTASKEFTFAVPSSATTAAAAAVAAAAATTAASVSMMTPTASVPTPQIPVMGGVDLRSVMNVPMSVASTPVIQRSIANTLTSAAAAAAHNGSRAAAAAQEQLIHMLRIQQHQQRVLLQQQQQQQRHQASSAAPAFVE